MSLLALLTLSLSYRSGPRSQQLQLKILNFNLPTGCRILLECYSLASNLLIWSDLTIHAHTKGSFYSNTMSVLHCNFLEQHFSGPNLEMEPRCWPELSGSFKRAMSVTSRMPPKDITKHLSIIPSCLANVNNVYKLFWN